MTDRLAAQLAFIRDDAVAARACRAPQACRESKKLADLIRRRRDSILTEIRAVPQRHDEEMRRRLR